MAVRKLRNVYENQTIGARLRDFRTASNMTQKELGARLGVSYQQVQKYETGKNAMTVPAMKKLAAALEIDACEICGCCEEPT